MSGHVPISDGTHAAGKGLDRASRGLGGMAIVRAAGSLWYAAVLLMLILVAMACATIYERAEGTERALAVFYRSRWFCALLCLLAINVAAAMVVRFPFGRRQIGFVITHVSILITLAGALITARFGIDGQVGVAEGQTVDSYRLPVHALSIADAAQKSESSISLDSRDFSSYEVVDDPNAPPLTHGGVRIEIARYLPDSEMEERVANDNPLTQHAILVSLSESGADAPQWVFAGKPASLGERDIHFRLMSDPSEFASLAEGRPATSQADSVGTVKVSVGETTHDVALSACRESPVAVADTGYSIRVLHYYPHASVGANSEIRNASPEPVNPAIEVELTGPEGAEKRMAFAKFPDFESMHGDKKARDVKVVLVAPEDTSSPNVPIEVIRGPEGHLLARFAAPRSAVLTRELTPRTPVESPWPLQRFTVLDQYDHARIAWTAVPVTPRQKARTPAVQLRLTCGDEEVDLSIQKYRSVPTTIGGRPYKITFSDTTAPFGFDVTLDKFTIVRYPGSMQPRSFESRVTLGNKSNGESISKLVSMNNPAQFAGLTLFQSSYRIDGNQRISFLSVSRDPGMGVVFVGYIGMIVGMIIVLVTRAVEHRRRPSPVLARGASIGRDNGRKRVDSTGAPGSPAAGGHSARKAGWHSGERSRVIR